MIYFEFHVLGELYKIQKLKTLLHKSEILFGFPFKVLSFAKLPIMLPMAYFNSVDRWLTSSILHVYNGWCCNSKSSALHYWEYWSSITGLRVCACPLAEMVDGGEKNLFSIEQFTSLLQNMCWCCRIDPAPETKKGTTGNLHKRRYFMPEASSEVLHLAELYIGGTPSALFYNQIFEFSQL